MKYLKISLALFTMIAFFSCKNEKKEEETVVEESIASPAQEITVVGTNTKFNDAEIAAIYETYLQLKDALVKTNAEEAAKQAGQLMTAFANEGVDIDLLMAAQKIQETKDVEIQRSEFSTLTEGMESLLSEAIAGGKVYKQFCPMAFNNKGGYWLSDSEEIRNPYFGDKMLNCGKVTAEIK